MRAHPVRGSSAVSLWLATVLAFGLGSSLAACASASSTPATQPAGPARSTPSQASLPAGALSRERFVDWVLDRARAHARAGHWEAGIQLVTSAAELAPDPRLIVWHAEFLRLLERYDDAALRYAEARSAAEAGGDERTRAKALHGLGEMQYVMARYFYAAEPAAALPLLEQARALWERLGEQAELSNTLYRLGTVHEALAESTGKQAEHQAQARAQFERARALAEASGSRAELSTALTHLAADAAGRGEREEALRLDERALALAREDGNQRLVAFYLANLGGDHLALEHVDEARRHMEDALALSQRLGMRLNIVRTQLMLADLHLARQDLARALAHAEQAIAVAEQAGYKHLLFYSLVTAARLYEGQRQLAAARDALVRLAGIVDPAGRQAARAPMDADLAWVHAALGQLAESRAAAQAWLRARHAAAGPDERARIHLAVGLLLEARDLSAAELAAALGAGTAPLAHYERAAALAGEAKETPMRVAAWIEQGRHLAASRQRARATAVLRQARDEATATKLGELAAYAGEVARRSGIAL